jgi:hypothetical protein
LKFSKDESFLEKTHCYLNQKLPLFVMSSIAVQVNLLHIQLGW